jgi:hypothetical protein
MVKLLDKKRQEMTWVIVNYINSQSPFETWDVKKNKIVKKKTSIFEKIIKLLSIVSYIPTSLTLLRYLLSHIK